MAGVVFTSKYGADISCSCGSIESIHIVLMGNAECVRCGSVYDWKTAATRKDGEVIDMDQEGSKMQPYNITRTIREHAVDEGVNLTVQHEGKSHEYRNLSAEYADALAHAFIECAAFAGIMARGEVMPYTQINALIEHLQDVKRFL